MAKAGEGASVGSISEPIKKALGREVHRIFGALAFLLVVLACLLGSLVVMGLSVDGSVGVIQAERRRRHSTLFMSIVRVSALLLAS